MPMIDICARSRLFGSANLQKRFSEVVSLKHADDCLRGRFQAVDNMLPIANASGVDQRGYLREEGSIELWRELVLMKPLISRLRRRIANIVSATEFGSAGAAPL